MLICQRRPPPGEQHLAAFRAHLLELSLSGSGLEPGADMFQFHATANYPLHCVPGRPYKSSHAEMLEQGLPGTVSTSFRGSPDGIELSQHRASSPDNLAITSKLLTQQRSRTSICFRVRLQASLPHPVGLLGARQWLGSGESVREISPRRGSCVPGLCAAAMGRRVRAFPAL